MNSQKIVLQETGIAAIGVSVCVAAMLWVFALLGKFDASALLGGIAGAALAVGNFFFMAVGTSLAGDRAERQDVAGGKRLLRNSYGLRLGVLFVLLLACGKSGWFNRFALVLPLLFVRPSLTIGEFFRKTGDREG